MNTFNLTFSGNILPGYDLQRVKAEFGKLSLIDDPARIDQFFTGKSTILRRGLDRKEAGTLYAKFRRVGADVALEKVSSTEHPGDTSDAARPPGKERTPTPEPRAADSAEKRGMDHEIREAHLGRIDQSWPVSAARASPEQAAARAKVLEVVKISEQAARKRALENENRRKADEEAARLRARENEARRQAQLEKAKVLAHERQKRATELAELEARLAREREQDKVRVLEAKRKAAEDAAREKALREENQRKAAEEATRLRAAKAQEQRERSAEEARSRLAEKQRMERQAARLDAQRVEEAASEKARRQEAKLATAREAKERYAQKREEKRKAAEESARLKAERAEKKRRVAEESARLRAQRAETKRAEAELAASLKAEQRQEQAQKLARLKERKAAEKAQREALARAERERAAQQALQMEAQAAQERRLEAEEIAREQSRRLAQLKTQDAQGARRGKTVPKSIGRSKPTRSTVKTSRNVPVRGRQSESGKQTAPRPSRAPGAPNFFRLRPFRNTEQIRGRAERSGQLRLIALTSSVVALFALAVLGTRFLLIPKTAPVTGATAMAVNQKSELLLVAGDRLLIHDRAGIGSEAIEIESLGLANISSPPTFSAPREILLLGQTRGQEEGSATRQLIRCELTEPQCLPVSLPPDVQGISALAMDSGTGAMYLADAQAGKLFKVTPGGELAAQVDITVPDRVTIVLQSGLIYINSGVAPAISVLRPDDHAFGQQLDEVMLLPPLPEAAEHSRVADFVWSSGNWWITLYNPDTLAAGVYRFDDQWNYIDKIAIPASNYPDQLLAWADKTLILDSKRNPIPRFNASGHAEAPLNSDSLQAFTDQSTRSINRSAALWKFLLGVLAIAALVSLGLEKLFRLRTLVYRPGLEQGAEPFSERDQPLTWIEPATNRQTRFRAVAITYCALSLVLLTTTATLAESPLLILAVLIWLSGPAIALFLLHTGEGGNIGVLQGKLLVVDHSNRYHLGMGPRIFYRKHFVMVDDIVVFSGTAYLPAFDRAQFESKITPLAEAGIKVDRKTVLIKLLQSGHPIAKGAVACLVSTVLAAMILLLA